MLHPTVRANGLGHKVILFFILFDYNSRFLCFILVLKNMERYKCIQEEEVCLSVLQYMPII